MNKREIIRLAKIFKRAGDQLINIANTKNPDAQLKEYAKFEKILEKLGETISISRPETKK
tara:strand:+ start:14903 stop:15082 length:180 start_codon:yes stop_codon:yes gene_type:complete